MAIRRITLPAMPVLMVLGVLLFLLAACEEGIAPGNKEGEMPVEAEELQPDAAEIVKSAGAAGAEEVDKEPVPCTYTSECTGENECIDSTCQLLTDLYSFDCGQKCTLKKVNISTSDGDSYMFSPGQGSYTAAGGLAWDVLRLPEHCPAEAPLAAFQLTYKTTGKVLGESIVTVAEGQESEVITHPALPSVKFRLKVDEVEMEC